MSTFRRSLRQFLVTSLVFGMVMTSGWGAAPVLADDAPADGQTLEAPQPSADDAVAPDSVDALSQDMTFAPTVLAAAAPESPFTTENVGREDATLRYHQAEGPFGVSIAALCGGQLTPWVPAICPPPVSFPVDGAAHAAALGTVGALVGAPGLPPTPLVVLAGIFAADPLFVSINNPGDCLDPIFSPPQFNGANNNLVGANGVANATRAAQTCQLAAGARALSVALSAAACAASNLVLLGADVLPSPPAPPPPPAGSWAAETALRAAQATLTDAFAVGLECGIPMLRQLQMYGCGYVNYVKGGIEGFFCGLAICAPFPFGIPCVLTFLPLTAQHGGEGFPVSLDTVGQSTGRRAIYADRTVGPNCGDGNCDALAENCCNCSDDCGACTGECCVANSTPGCDGDGGGSMSCCELVCAAHPECCDTSWDDIPDCVILANALCEECGLQDFPELDDPIFVGDLSLDIAALVDMLEDFQAGPLILDAVMAMETYTCNSTSMPGMVHIKARLFFDAIFDENEDPIFDLEEVVLDSLALNGIPASGATIKQGVIVITIGKGNDGIVPGPCPMTTIVSGSTNGGTILVASDPAGNRHFATPLNNAKQIMLDLGYMEIPGN